MPPLILVKSDGAVLYGTTDLATMIERVREHDPDLILYVVDQRQHGHFEQVFRAARARPGLNGKAVLEHAGFGTMNGTDGKPFKTRAGGVMKLYDLIAMATAEAEKRLAEQGIGADYSAPRSAPRSRARSASPPSNSPISPTTAPPITFSTWSASRNSRARPGPICNMRRCASNRSCARQGRGPRRRRARHPFAGRAQADSATAVAGRCAGGGGRQARAQHPVRICLRAGAEFQPLLCRAPHPVRNGRGLARRAAGPLRLTLDVLTRVLGLLGIEVPERM